MVKNSVTPSYEHEWASLQQVIKSTQSFYKITSQKDFVSIIPLDF